MTTSYGQSINQRILVIHDAADSTAPAATVAWVTSIGTLGGTEALHVVARNPVVNGPDLVYRLDDTTTGRALECLVTTAMRHLTSRRALPSPKRRSIFGQVTAMPAP